MAKRKISDWSLSWLQWSVHLLSYKISSTYNIQIAVLNFNIQVSYGNGLVRLVTRNRGLTKRCRICMVCPENEDPDQTFIGSLTKVYTVCKSICLFWTALFILLYCIQKAKGHWYPFVWWADGNILKQNKIQQMLKVK